jgi:hypothetical protein
MKEARMRARLILVSALLAGSLLVASSTSNASHHLWRLKSLFSNADGSVQWVQLFVTDSGEPNVGAFTVKSNTNTFSFLTNLPNSNTANTWILLATSNFAALHGGIAPDYIIPANFFSTGGDTLTYATTVDSWTFGAVPMDGVSQLNRDGTTARNVAINFAGQSTTVNLGQTVPAVGTWGVALLVGALLLVGSGLLRARARRNTAAA